MARRYKKPKREGGLIITSLVDIFTLIVVFLIMNYSAEGNILTNAENLTLPYSVSKASPKEVTVSLNCAADWITIDNDPVVPTPRARAQESIVLDGVVKKLEHCMEQEESMVRIGALTRLRAEIVIQMDKNMDFDVIYKIMASCGQAGYTNIRLAVLSKE